MLVGTHALIQKSVQFEHLAYAIVDEQHRFGTRQRRALAKKGDSAPHFLSMTATPIPRTLATHALRRPRYICLGRAAPVVPSND